MNFFSKYNVTMPITLYISIVTGSLLTISEILPFVSCIKSNGVLQCIVSMFNSIPFTSPNSQYTQLVDDEMYGGNLSNTQLQIQLQQAHGRITHLEEKIDELLKNSRLEICTLEHNKTLQITVHTK